jgi:4-hydroxy-tetrahydrodipicolinate reductase
MFTSEGERIEITHRATSRKLFVAGALRAAEFVAQMRSRGETGVFDMPDVLGLRS